MAQTTVIDSMERALQQQKEDSVRVLNIVQLAYQCYLFDSAKGLRYLNEGYRLIKKLKWNYATADYYENKAMIHMTNSSSDGIADLLYDSAIMYYQKAIDENSNKKEVSDARLSIATCNAEKGVILSGKEKYKEAIAAYIAALEAWQHSNDPSKNQVIATYYSDISTIYYKLKQFEKALEYDKLSLTIFSAGTNEQAIAFAQIYVCDDYITLKQLDSATLYLTKAEPIIKRLNILSMNIQYYNKLGAISKLKNNFKEAIGFYNHAMSEAKKNNDSFQVASSQKVIGFCYEKMGDFSNARKFLLLALNRMPKGYKSGRIEILQELINTEEKTNNKSQAFDYLKELTALKDSLNTAASKNDIAAIENKYQAAEKSKEIIKLNADGQIQSLTLKQKSTLNYFLIGSLVALLIVGLSGYRNFRNRQQLAKQQDELQQQRISELEKDKQLVAVDSMLKGQEDERSRLAKDLHDGLGGLLSGVKFSLTNMKDNLIITPDNMTVFERSLDMIDTSIRELRRVAHNMMPEMLTKFGLDEALKEYCNSINTTKLLTVKYQSLGMEARLDKSVEIIIYRIIQELLNNIMKHAAATEAFVQLIKEENRLNVVVEDNGKGFDKDIDDAGKGVGLANIRSRVDYLKGQLDIHAEAGKGTLVNIEFNI
jgi:signal transduction histidine kinase